MKKTVKLSLAILSLSALTGVANAAVPGAYAGLGLGASSLDTPSTQQIFNSKQIQLTGGSTSSSKGGLGETLFAGYNFNQYFGVEGGFLNFANSTYKANYKAVSVNRSVKYSMDALDLVAKGYLPIPQSGFNLYALGGLAYVNSEMKASQSSPVHGLNDSRSRNNRAFRPMVGAGISYDFPQTNVTTALEYSHIDGRGNTKTSTSAIPSANMIALKVAYNFG